MSGRVESNPVKSGSRVTTREAERPSRAQVAGGEVRALSACACARRRRGRRCVERPAVAFPSASMAALGSSTPAPTHHPLPLPPRRGPARLESGELGLVMRRRRHKQGESDSAMPGQPDALPCACGVRSWAFFSVPGLLPGGLAHEELQNGEA
jgi:hypothetical protein